MNQIKIDALNRAKVKFLDAARELKDVAPTLALKAAGEARECELRALTIGAQR